jgi:Cdc6-like AAA superfamily ATPase
MRDQIDDALSSILGGKKSNYTLDEIKEAEKLKRKNGGSLLDNLRAITGRRLPDTSSIIRENMDIMRMCEERGIDINMPDSHYDIQKELDELGKNLEADFGPELSQKATAPAEEPPVTVDAQAFKGVDETVGKTVFGQDEFLKKLLIAFKRPIVMPPKDKMPLNSIYVNGEENTGRHLALKTMAKELAARKVIRSGEIRVMDLSLYPTSTEEKLFLQDLYSALMSKSQIILIENYDSCHTAYLNTLSELVMTGECKLASRYILQNGQMISVSNGLANDAVGTLSAKNKYLVFISTKKLEKLADCFGAPFVNALGDVCTTAKLDADALHRISEREQAELVERADRQLGFKVTCSEDFVAFAVTKAEKNAGLAGILDFYENCLKGLAQIRLEEDLEKDTQAVLSVKEGVVYADIAGRQINLLGTLPDSYTGEIEAVKAEMDKIVGLKTIKEYIFSLEEYYRAQIRRREEGLKASEVSKHMIFTGSPGTGKTTIARIVSRYLKAIGVLTGGQLVEVSRADLVGRYVGHTAPLTNQVINSAIGGVLFIDEAYSLYRGKDDSFGLEAIDTLVKGMEDNRDNLIVILAGYSKEMQEFLTSNSGLKSRFPNIINFPDYTGEELLAIAKINAASKGYTIDEGAEPGLLSYFNAVQALRAADAGNGRLARNKIEEAILNQSKRLVAEPDADLSLLTSLDFDLDDIGG